MLDLHAEVHDDQHAGGAGALGGGFVDNFQLAPDPDLDTLGDGVVDNFAKELGAAKDVNNIDVERHLDQ